jgi:hypothetical protein
MTTWTTVDRIAPGVIGAPLGLAFSPAGDLYVADFENRIWKATIPGYTASVFAGSGATGHADGTGTAATFTHPGCLAFDASGNLYAGEWGKIRKISPAAVVTTIAGDPFTNAQGLVCDDDGNLYVVSWDTTIGKITPAGTASTLATVTGGVLSTIAYDASSGDLFVTDSSALELLRVTLAGVVTTEATIPYETDDEHFFSAFDPSGVLHIVVQNYDVTPARILRYSLTDGWLDPITLELGFNEEFNANEQVYGIACGDVDTVISYQFGTQISAVVAVTAVLRTVGGTFASPGGVAQVHLKQEDGTWPAIEDIT